MTVVPFTCPACHATSHHPMDEAEGYCGRCHAFTGRGLPLIVVFHNPTDYPGKYVTRVQVAVAGGVVHAPQPFSITDTLEEARASLPHGMTVIPRDPDDEPQIVETWV